MQTLVRMHAYAPVNTYIHMHMHMCAQTRSHIRAHVHASVHMHTHTYTLILAHMWRSGDSLQELSSSLLPHNMGPRETNQAAGAATSHQPRVLFSKTFLVLEALHFLSLRATPLTWDTLLRSCE